MGIPVSYFSMGIPWKWEWTTCNLGKGMGIVTRECEGMRMGKCGKIPVPHSTDTHEQPPSLKKRLGSRTLRSCVILMKTPIQFVINWLRR